MTLQDFFYMGGYAFYVWGSYLTALILIAGEVLALSRRKQRLAATNVAANRLSEDHDQ